MRYSISLTGLALLVAALLSTPAAPAADRDCGDFANQRKAQIFFLKQGGPRSDPHRLDADHDGIACEANPCPCYKRKTLPRARAWPVALMGSQPADTEPWQLDELQQR